MKFAEKIIVEHIVLTSVKGLNVHLSQCTYPMLFCNSSARANLCINVVFLAELHVYLETIFSYEYSFR